MDTTNKTNDLFYASLTNLERDAFVKQIQSVCESESDVLKLRSQFVKKVSEINECTLKLPLPSRPATKRITSISRYIDDCFALQRFIDGRTSTVIFDATPRSTNIYEVIKTCKRRKEIEHSERNFNLTLPKMPKEIKLEPLINENIEDLLTVNTDNLTREEELNDILIQISSNNLQLVESKLDNSDRDLVLSESIGFNICKTEEIFDIDGIKPSKTMTLDVNEPVELPYEDVPGSCDDTLSMKVQEDDSVTFHITENSSLKGHSTLTSSDGYSYIIKRKTPLQTTWLCRVRMPTICGAILCQRGSKFYHGSKKHCHSADPRILREFGKEVKQEEVEAFVDQTSRVTISRKKEKYVCAACELSFVFRKDLEDHNEEVHGSRYQCIECCRSFTNHHSYKRHMITVHTFEKPFTCDICGKTFHLEKMLVNHRATHQPKIRDRICRECGKAFHSDETLKKHIVIHSIPQHLCMYCGKMFKKQQHLREHTNFHTREILYRCLMCDRTFPHSTPLRLHIRRQHTGERPYSCLYCEKTFVCSSDQKSHERVHTGQKRRKSLDSQSKSLTLLTEATRLVERNNPLELNYSNRVVKDINEQITVGRYEEIPSEIVLEIAE